MDKIFISHNNITDCSCVSRRFVPTSLAVILILRPCSMLMQDISRKRQISNGGILRALRS